MLDRRVALALPLFLAPTSALAQQLAPPPPAPVAPSALPPPPAPPPPPSSGVTASAGVILPFPVTDVNQGKAGVGGEASFMYFPGGGLEKPELSQAMGVGAFVQGEELGHRGRFAIGGQAGTWVGGELGGGFRTPDGAHAGDVDLHAALFLSLGILGVDLRATAPLAKTVDSALPSAGAEVAIVLAIKIPFLVQNVGVLTSYLGSGRPLHDGERALFSELLVGDADGRHRGATSLHELAADQWANDGLMEHASVPAFARLAIELELLRAPRSLSSRASRAAHEEIGHARACFALASKMKGRQVTASRWPLPRARVPSLEQVAVESWVDGCVGEAAAARTMREAAEGVPAPGVRRALAQIARDEARHAALAWDVVTWAVDAGGAPVRRALARAALPPVDAIANGGPDLRHLGRLSAKRSTAIRDDVARRAVQRRDQLLS